jgi:hypothetical protein
MRQYNGCLFCSGAQIEAPSESITNRPGVSAQDVSSRNVVGLQRAASSPNTRQHHSGWE